MSVQETDQSYPATTFIWTIKNFELYEKNVNLSSPVFTVITCPELSLSLDFHDEDFTENSKYFSLFLRNSRNALFFPYGVVYSFIIGIITRDRKQNCLKFDTTFENEQRIGETKFIEKETLMYSEKQLMLPDGNLTLFCEVSVCEVPLNMEDRFYANDFSYKFLKLYESGKYSDVTLEVQDKKFKIHSAIIEARFSDLLKTLNGSICKIENISAKTVEALLEYIYSGYLKVNDVNWYEVFASDYKIPTHLESLLSNEPYLQHQKIKVVSRIGRKDISFTWKIHNFNSLEPGKCRFFRWFKVFLTLSNNKENLIISIERFFLTSKKMICNIKILSGLNKSFFHCFEENRWTLPDIPLTDIFTKDINFSSECDVNLDFKISFSDRMLVSHENQTTYELFSYEDPQYDNVKDLVSLQKNISDLYLNKYCYDVLLKSKTLEIKAHKCILSTRSTIFADMLQNEAAVNDNKVIIDLEYRIAENLIYYIYTNSFRFGYDQVPTFDVKFVIDLYNAADKYKLLGLRGKCSELFKKILNGDIAGEVLIAAYDCDDTQLKEFIYNYVCSNPQEIQNSRKWDDAMKRRADVSTEMLHKTLSHIIGLKAKVTSKGHL